MTSTFRSLTFGLATLLGAGAMAQQPSTWSISGSVLNCYAGQTIDMQIYDGLDPMGPLLITQQVPVDPITCTYSAYIGIPVQNAYMVASTQCSGMVITLTDSAWFAFTQDTVFTSLPFNCGSVSQCNACFTAEQATNGGNPVPFQADFTNCSTGNAPMTFLWLLPDGSTSANSNVGWVFNAPGVYGVCLTITDMTGCTSWLCDTVVVDANGDISFGAPVYDCMGVPSGSALPGTPCTVPGTILPGTWNAACVCVPDNPAPCEADFWVMQAYSGVDSLGNPNGGGEPIPNVLWVWNLSSGGTGEFTYFWNFGDGSSSTEAFPTHTYPNGGPYLLCLTITDGSCTSTYCDSISVDENGMYSGMIVGSEVRSALTINVIQPLSTGVIERPAVAEMATWPNPVSDELNIQLTSNLRGNVNVDILDLSGRTVRATTHVLTSGANRLSLATSDLTPGVYVLRIGSGSKAQVLRFVKTR